MILIIDTGIAYKVLAEKQPNVLDIQFRTKYPGLVAWGYRHADGELTLDFGDTEENQFWNVVRNRITLTKSEGKFIKATILGREHFNEDLSTA